WSAAAPNAKSPENATGAERYPRNTSVRASCARISVICVNASRSSIAETPQPWTKHEPASHTLHDKVSVGERDRQADSNRILAWAMRCGRGAAIAVGGFNASE